MKKTLVTINLLFALGMGAFAQLDAGRTGKTKIADALAAMPAKNLQLYNQAMQDIASAGESGLTELVRMREAATGEARVKLDYALNSISDYATGLSDKTLSKTLSSVFMQAVSNTSSNESAAFYMKQLRTLADDSCISFLGGYLDKDSLAPFAARALCAIGNEQAEATLLSRLTTVNPQFRKNIVNALGEMQAQNAEDALLSLNNMEGADLNVLHYSLGRCGSSKSVAPLAKASRQAGYTMEPTGATESYIMLLNKLSATDPKVAMKEAASLMKAAEKSDQTPARSAALEIILGLKPEVGRKLVLDALKDSDREYRNAALLYAENNADDAFYQKLFSRIPKAQPEVQEDLVAWAGRNKLTPALPAILPLLNAQNNELAAKAADAAARIGGQQALEALANMLTSSSDEQIEVAVNALTYTSGNVPEMAMKHFDQADDKGKQAILGLVSSRKADQYADLFFTLCESNGSSALKQQALAGLSGVVTGRDLPRLFKLLATTEIGSVTPVQKALVAALSTFPENQRFDQVNRQMATANTSVQPRYFAVLAATGDNRALPVIEKGFAANDAGSRDMALDALCQWNGMEAVDPLYAICADPASSAYFDKAMDAYIDKVASADATGEKKLIFLRKGLDIAGNNAQKNRLLREIQKTNTFLGLLTAGRYLEDPAVSESACQAVMNIALNNPQYAGKQVEDLLKTVMVRLDNPDAGYQKQAIQKYFAENPSQAGFVSIFNEKDLEGWQGLVGNPVSRQKMNASQLRKSQQQADEAMRNSWSVENGVLVFNGKGDNLCTTKKYGDFEMYVDWMLDPAGPEADAGIYLRGTPQVQIWDTARVNVGAQVGSGGLYNNQKNPSNPTQVSDNRLGEWNSFFIRMVGERVTVFLNGEKVVDNVIMENYWDRSQPIPMLEQIELQAHGSKVSYRDLYVRELPRAATFQLSPEEAKDGFNVLFDGSSMINWTGNTKDYVAEDGCIVLYPKNGGGGNLYTKNEYGDFVYRFEFQLTPGANNGLGIRTPMEGDAAYVGMELQILDNEDPIYSTLEKYQYHGSVYGVIPAKRGFLKEPGEWNVQEVVAQGDHIKVTLNGEVILDGNIREAGGNGTMDKREHPGLFNKKGHIGFLGHGSEVRFRNIRIKEL